MGFSIPSKAQKNDSIQVLQAATEFVNAFNTFNWDKFRNSFTEDATMFHPFWEQAKRRTGRKEIEDTWLEVFPEFINNPKNDSLQIDPK